MDWINGDKLLVYCQSAQGGSVRHVTPNESSFVGDPMFPKEGSLVRGQLVCAKAAPSGLVAVGFGVGSGGHISIVACPSMDVLAEMPCQVVPFSMSMITDFVDDGHHLTVSYQKGGIEIWKL